MIYVAVSGPDGIEHTFSADTIPVCEQEVQRQLSLYYRTRCCERCRRAVVHSGFARLVTELEDGAVSEETKALFPIAGTAAAMRARQF